MPTYKITRVYVVEAESRIDARITFTGATQNNKEDEYLEYIGIQELSDRKSTGWKSSLKEQLLGSSNAKR